MAGLHRAIAATLTPHRVDAVVRVGLTGGIGAGKSEVARRLAARGAVLLDADVVAREVVAPGTDGLRDVVTAFGEGILRPDGSLDRQRLGALVFADPTLRATLNRIVHPLVRRRMRELERAATRRAGPETIVVHDVALLVENGLAGEYDVVVVVDVPPQLQVDRLVRDRGMSPDQARARMAAQADRKQRLAVADIVVDNSGSLADLDRQVDALWADLTRRAAR